MIRVPFSGRRRRRRRQLRRFPCARDHLVRPDPHLAEGPRHDLHLLRAVRARRRLLGVRHEETVRGTPPGGGRNARRRSASLPAAAELGVARFIDASIYRDTFPAIRIAILFFTIAIFFFFFFHNDFHLGRKDT